MMRHTLLLLTLVSFTAFAAKDGGKLLYENLSFDRAGSKFHVSVDIVLDSLEMSGNRQLFVTPVIEGTRGESVELPSVLINGRNMHYAYERGTLPSEVLARYDILKEVRRHNGQTQQVAYTTDTPLRAWMYAPGTSLRLLADTCGCGRLAGRDLGKPIPLNLNPAPQMLPVHITPAVTELPITIHEGQARVQFEVNRTELHPEPYTCRNGQRIDNREQLSIIEDSIRYATTNPNVEIARIDICGYASPESPYLHNEFLATNRSRALAEYIGDKFKLPADRCTYSSVPENWTEFRTQVLDATDISEQQRADLLALIDEPAYGPSDYDAKERTLKTDPRFAKLYRSTILPKWFPKLRCTKFAISTRLKPMSDPQLAEIIKTTPELMSLNQMFRVARLYPEGSDDFNRTIATALSHYPNDPVANLNAAVTAIGNGDYDSASKLLEKAGNSPEAENARGIIATHRGDFKAAVEHFDAAAPLPEAARNKALIEIPIE